MTQAKLTKHTYDYFTLVPENQRVPDYLVRDDAVARDLKRTLGIGLGPRHTGRARPSVAPGYPGV